MENYNTNAQGHGLPLYEGVDWNIDVNKKSIYILGLPLYEGVDWNTIG